METRRMLHDPKAGPTRSRRGDKRVAWADSDGVGPDPGLQPPSVCLISHLFHIAASVSALTRAGWGIVFMALV